MSIGYLILAHHKPGQLLRLIRVIRAQSEGPIIVHLDRKSVGDFRTIMPDFQAIDHLQISSIRRVGWGDYSTVQAVLDCMTILCREFPGISHVKQLSGQDYPIKPVSEFERLMAGRGEKSSMEIHRLPRTELGRAGGLERVQYTYLHKARRFALHLPFKRRLPNHLTFYAGSQFWCLSRKHCLHALSESAKWRSLFLRSLLPDELFFHTILMNSQFTDEVINEDITYTRWEENAPSPSLLGIEDIPELIRSRSYFARKFDIDQDPRIMDRLDQRIGVDAAASSTNR